MARTEKLYAFLDTNVFLEFREYTQLDWPKLLDAREVVLVVAPTVRREVEKHRTNPRSPRLQKRARDVSGKLRTLMLSVDDGEEAVITDRPNTTYLELSRSPRMANHPDLAPDEQDDRIIASMLEFREEHPDWDMMLIAGDTGIIATARRNGLSYRYLEDEYRLPDEPTAEQREIRELKSKVSKLEKSSPELVVSFKGCTESTLLLPRVTNLYLDTVRHKVVEKLEDLRSYEWASSKAEPSSQLQPTDVSLLSSLVLPSKRPHNISKEIVERISSRVHKLGIGPENFHESLLRPRGVYLDFGNTGLGGIAFGQSGEVVGEGTDWYWAVRDLDEHLEELEMMMHNAMQMKKYPSLELCLENVGGVTADELDIEIETPDDEMYLFTSIDLWEEPNRLPYLPSLSSGLPQRDEPKWELSGMEPFNPLHDNLSALKPGEQTCWEVGYIRVPGDGQSVKLNVRILGRNLSLPIEAEFVVRSQ